MDKKGQFSDWKIVIPSKLDHIEKVSYDVSMFAREIGYHGNRLTELDLVLLETVTNAIKHGNKFDDNKKIRVAWHQEESGIRITIEDEGDGFNPDDVPDPLAPENIAKESGRGIYFLKQLSKEVQFNKKGNCVSFLFHK